MSFAIKTPIILSGRGALNKIRNYELSAYKYTYLMNKILLLVLLCASSCAQKKELITVSNSKFPVITKRNWHDKYLGKNHKIKDIAPSHFNNNQKIWYNSFCNNLCWSSVTY